MKVSKKFRWEGAHRLPWHQEGCQNLHGHSYNLWVELEGEPDDRGMLIDFKVIKTVLKPLVDAWDHATIISEGDSKLKEAVALLKSKHYILPYDSTSENLCRFVLQYMLENASEVLRQHRIHTIKVRISETETSYAELSRKVNQ